jgi:HK97 family phage major capsid protein
MIPEEIIYNPEAEVNSVADLSALVTKTPATTGSGTYPILKRAVAVMNTVEELAESPELAKPEFEEVTWKIATYRGKIPISEESLQDTQVPLMPVIQRNASEQRLNTLNKAISAKLVTFNAKASTADTVADDLKHVLNVDLDPAYDKTIVVSQSAYQVLDTLKDKEGRYLLQESITASSGLTLFGKQVVVVNDELLGKVGEAHIWVGDLKRAILYVNRLDTQITWVKNEIFGQYLGLAMRFDVEVADSNAGYFITVGAGASAGAGVASK